MKQQSKKLKYFILFNDQSEIVQALSDSHSGLLFKAIFNHVTGKAVKLPNSLKPVFILFRQGIDRNLENYKKICETNKNNISKRWNQVRNNTTVYDRIPTNTNGNNKKKNTKKNIYINTPFLKGKELNTTQKNAIWAELEAVSEKEVSRKGK